MEAIPHTLATDPEDVAWALQTAETLWKRHERADAIVWLRRAAQAAGDAEQDDRALALARHAAELSDWMAQNPVGAPPGAVTVASEPPAAGGGVDDLLRVSMADIPISVSDLDDMQEAPTEMLQRPPVPPVRLEDSQEVPTEMLQRPPDRAARLEESQEAPTEMLPRPSRPSAPAHWPAPEPSPLARTTELARASEADTPEGGAPIAPPAQQVHAGILDPWAQVPPPPPTAPISDTDFVTSAQLPAAPPALAAEPATPAPAQVAPPPAQVAPPPPQVAPPPVQAAAPAATGKPAPPKRKPPPLPKKPPVPKKPPARTAAKRRPSIPPEPAPISVEPSSLQVQEEEKFYTSDPMAVLRAARTSQPPAVEVAPPPPSADAAPPPEPLLRDEAPTRKSEVLAETAEVPLHLSTGELRAAVPYLAGSQLPTMEVEAARVEALPEAPKVEALPEAPKVEALPEAPRVEALPEAPRVEALPEAPRVEALPETTGPRLDDVDALADLPDDERAALSRTAAVQTLSKDEEIEGFALALVLEGSVDVAATIADAPAERLAAGTMLKAKGTLAEESVPLKLVAPADGTVVATWTAEQIEHTFRSCPWVEDELRAQANRVQALVGLTLGALAERLDASLRMQFTSRLDVRELVEGEVVVEAGQPMRTMVVVGQGKLELVEGGVTKQELGPGDFLFPTEILGAGVAPQTARAGKGGALVLCADRGLAQELMITCPPLLEIFAGM